VFAIVAVVFNRSLIDRVRWLARSLTFPGLKSADSRRYTSAVDDLFSVPLGYVDPDQGPDNELSLPSIPAEAFEHRGKWLALRGRKILAIRDSRAELRKEFGHRRTEVRFFHVPETRNFAR
jgi:hypothetical protein